MQKDDLEHDRFEFAPVEKPNDWEIVGQEKLDSRLRCILCVQYLSDFALLYCFWSDELHYAPSINVSGGIP